MTVFFGFRLPVDLKRYVCEQAKKHRTSMAHYIVMLILYDMMDKSHQEKMKGVLQNGDCNAETFTD